MSGEFTLGDVTTSFRAIWQECADRFRRNFRCQYWHRPRDKQEVEGIMEEFWTSLMTGFAFLCVLEGLLYALIPTQMQRMMAAALTFSPTSLRRVGMGALVFGIALVWLIRH
ncbi:MAG: hypothetical protein CMM78_07315 [Rhodospirillaceae bacterium]|jgi:uncharacterized protein YjeT (DUF2065 family)|nr:hypothetical protein [Rhodospirillales bacterium]MAX48004.1 hypothetical protein [Rhodospirillaceae bacterium]|tara:strand:- start:102 stop:437 length:336 start_codon:yes stop_codon:yes gene_type:complete